MKFITFLIFTIFPVYNGVAAEGTANSLSDAEKSAGWRLLFDGEDASAHWRGFKKEELPAEWVVEDGALVRRGGGDIITKEKFDSFELTIDWRISEKGNSGIIFKVIEEGRRPHFTGPEAQILDNSRAKEPQKAGWLYQLYPASVDATKSTGEWNTFLLKCRKNAKGNYLCEHWLNGTKYVEYEIGSKEWHERVSKSKFAGYGDFATAEAGHIALQDHGNLVSFRNIKIRPLLPLK